MNKEQKVTLYRILAACVLFAAGLLLSGWVRFGFMLAAWAVAGYPVVLEAIENIAHGEVFDENFLMTLATVGAFAIGEAPEAAAVMIFFQIGELFEECAEERSRRSISELMALRPDTAFVLRGDENVEVAPEDIQAGDLLLVRPGERIPVDGVIVEGSADLDTAQITGESMPVAAGEGDRVVSGAIDISGVLKIRAESGYAHSTVAKILELVENASETKAPTERMITRFAKVYTPVVVLCAVLLAVIPPLFSGNWGSWISRALSFLVISCPCALVISVPLSFFGGMGAAARQGVIIKGGTVMEQLARAQIAAFDKTGTLTQGRFRVTEVTEGMLCRDEILYYAAGAEAMSSHPIAEAIRESVARLPEDCTVDSEEPGFGVIARVDGRRVLAGSARLMARDNISCQDSDCGTCVHVAVDGVYGGCIVIADSPKENSVAALWELKALGVEKAVLLTGDNEAAAREISAQLPLDEVHAKLLPQDKAKEMEKLLALRHDGGTVLYTGDGVNDAPVLVMADVGIAMGGVGSDAAVEAADVVILNDDLSKIACALRISEKTLRIARSNIIFALAVKLAILILAAFGIASMWLAVFADVGVTVLAILNAMRALHAK